MQIESRACQACLSKENANREQCQTCLNIAVVQLFFYKENANREQCQTCLNIAEVQLFFYNYAEMQLPIPFASLDFTPLIYTDNKVKLSTKVYTSR